jgi:hypothetical protein
MTARTTLRTCPNGAAVRGVRILYGMPSADMFEAAQRGEIALGDCVIGGDDPQWSCLKCGLEWGSRFTQR